jgi:hypothetical protein
LLTWCLLVVVVVVVVVCFAVEEPVAADDADGASPAVSGSLRFPPPPLSLSLSLSAQRVAEQCTYNLHTTHATSWHRTCPSFQTKTTTESFCCLSPVVGQGVWLKGQTGVNGGRGEDASLSGMRTRNDVRVLRANHNHHSYLPPPPRTAPHHTHSLPTFIRTHFQGEGEGNGGDEQSGDEDSDDDGEEKPAKRKRIRIVLRNGRGNFKFENGSHYYGACSGGVRAGGRCVQVGGACRWAVRACVHVCMCVRVCVCGGGAACVYVCMCVAGWG